MPRDETIMKRGRLICFMGIDGSGKSTLSKMLRDNLVNRGVKCRYLWWLEAENSVIRRTLKKLFSDRSKGGLKSSAKIPTGFLASLYQGIVYIDYLRQLFLQVSMPLWAGYTIICDRYIYDTPIAFAAEFGYSESRLNRALRLVRRLAPEPDAFFLIDVPPEIAFKRKADIPSVESLARPRSMYLDIAKDMNAIVINGTRDPDSLSRLVLENVRPLLENLA